MSDTRDVDTQLGTFRVYTQGTITRALEAGQWWDSHLKPAIDKVEPGIMSGVAVDIGAHFGWFSCYLASKFRRVFAVEPWPPSFALLQHNVAQHWATGLWPGFGSRVQCWPVAAYSRAELLGFSSMNNRSDEGSFGFAPALEHGTEMVAGVALDDYLPQDADVRLVKSDAQGADLQALQGMARTIARCRPLILFEWEEGLAQQHGSDWGDYLGFFEEIGYAAPERITTDYWDYVARPR